MFFRIFVVASLFSINAFASRPLALVYNGPGACPEKCAESAADVARSAGFRVHFVNPSNMTEASFDDAAVYVQPGGHSGDVSVKLSVAQKQMIRDFVANGGGYVGFCAGAFFAAQHIRAEDGGYLKYETLGLIPMVAHLFESDENAAILPLTWDGAARGLYWEGGPYFETPLAAGVDSIATYANGSMATVRTTFGQGRVFVTGTHPEAPDSWRTYYKLNDFDGLDTDLGRTMIRWAAGD